MTTIPIRVGDGIVDEIESVYEDITKKAYEKFLIRGGTFTFDIEDWLEAEREVIVKPEARLMNRENHFVIRVHVSSVNPKHLKVLVTADDTIIHSVESYPKR